MKWRQSNVEIYGVTHYKQGTPDDIQFWDDFRFKVFNGYYQFICLSGVNGRLPQCVGRAIDACRKSVGGEHGVTIKCLHPAWASTSTVSDTSLIIIAINKEFMVASSLLIAMNKDYGTPQKQESLERLSREIDDNDGIIIVAKSSREETLMRMLLQTGTDLTSIVDSLEDQSDEGDEECESD
jgi:hypothetical protein